MSTQQEKRIQALEQRYSPAISPEVRACAERFAVEAGVSADELIAGAERLMTAARPPYSVEQVATMIAGETGRTGAEVLAEARALD
jgi:cytidine deaminase